MASGNTLIVFNPYEYAPPATTYATLGVMAGTSTPAESVLILNFNDTTVQYADFYGVMPRAYSGGGLTLTIGWSAAQATNNGIWSAAFRRVTDSAVDLDTTAFTYDYNTTGDIAPAGTVGQVKYSTLTFTNGVDMDSVFAGDYFILRVKRPATSGTKITGDCAIHFIEVKET